jgi:hypothetical protein
LAVQSPDGLSLEETEMYDSCREIEQRLVADFFGVEPSKVSAIRHRRYWLEWADHLKHSGEVDCVLRHGTKALVIDYKTLPGDVPTSPSNLQLRDHAVLYEADTKLLSEVGVAVIQPLVTTRPQITLYKTEDIHRARGDMHARVKRSNDPNSPRVAGEIQCKWCRARTRCPEYNKWASALVITDRSIMETPVEQWTPIMRTNFMDRLPVAAKWLEDRKEDMKDLLKKDPASVPGYHLGKPKNMETITNLQAVLDAFVERGGTPEQFMQCVELVKGKLKEQLGAATKAKGQKLDAELKAVIGKNSTFKPTEPSIQRIKS